jgi:type I restriction enzyme S subunit
MGNYQGYQKYKDSGVEWLGNIPEHWEVKALRYVKSIDKNAFVDGPFGSNLKTIHYVTIGDVFVIESEFATRGKLVEEELKQITQEHFLTIQRSSAKGGDIIIAKIGAYFGLNNILPTLSKPAVVSGNSLKLSINTNICCTKFIHYLLLHLKKSGAIDLQVSITAQPALSLGGMNQLKSSIPPLNEQEKIAQFLDYKTKQIDELIKKKETLIEKLDEKRTALISHAVTKGLDSSVPMKDSGIEWLGDIPEHWIICRVKNLAKTITKGTTPSTEGQTFTEFGIRYIKAENIFNNKIILEPEFFISEETDKILKRSRLEEKDILFVIAGATIGKTAIVYENYIPANTNQAVSLIRPNRRVLPEFLHLWLQSDYTENILKTFSVQSAQPNISMEKLGDILVCLSPLNEQKQIAEYLDQKTTQIDQQKAKIKEAIELLKEYRTSLITNAVTGKIDVSQIAVP